MASTCNTIIFEPKTNNQTWRGLAACAQNGVGYEVFFSEELTEIAAAKRICATCDVMAECLESAIQRREPYGVWGGQLFNNGAIQMVKRRRGRPRKIARIEDEVPNIPIPERLIPLLKTA